LLKGKRALVFAAGGSIGAAIAREFAAQGAEVFMSGRTKSSIMNVAGEINAAGGRTHTATLDAVDEAAVGGYVDQVARDGSIDVVFNAIGPLTREFGGGKRALDLTVDEFMVPLTTVVRSQFVTARAAARQMRQQGSGVIMFVTGSPARPHIEGASAIGAAFAAIENLTRHLALELGPAGVRAVCLRTSAMPDTRTIKDVMQALAETMSVTQQQAAQMLASQTLMQKSPTSSETARVAAFLASDHARTITGTQVMSEIR
jgi:NAD(P)-dependent dehydrogenase (short-subunit alcohol dehydrogenase family)